ncbi:septal ring lytic transglycosylase RlpA family protein [Olivibacter sitiensis]|uniref:septal ring lytic transglycosylase RlpA family protein n=1 Tax=Olivibacter sitiensis TaxID=376470 RepID=UPI001FE172A8|nr:septal ring lytic transglycosylase RlpA family protein [Olivibacter sitiensis]
MYERGTAVSERGKASYYADRFHGKSTASGEKYNKNKLTAAHPSIPFGTMVTVKNMNNGKIVQVKVNDRGPSSGGRIMDISKAAAIKLDMIQAGVVPVEISYGKSGSNSTVSRTTVKEQKSPKKGPVFRRGKKK